MLNSKPHQRLRRLTPKDQRVEPSSCLYPDSLPPYEHPKEAVSKSLLQLDNPDWEVTMQGLQGVVRLSRHHAAFLVPIMHAIAVTVTKHIRNLRSQVSRAACQTASQLLKTYGRAFEGEVDELAGALFNRTADTNKFLRADCNAALDIMVDSISPVKSINAIVNRGAKHQNAIVRTAACRLLLKLNERLGPEKTLSLPRDARDAFLVSSARFLMEGSLETRCYAKEIFTNLSQDNKLPSILAEVVPNNIMRNISKVLSRLVILK
uniref:TOG domain-containing protein n=1 Tax=Clastoptera arizonana TaxID=38151 RepID=A0A1B6CRU9_9HEMI